MLVTVNNISYYRHRPRFIARGAGLLASAHAPVVVNIERLHTSLYFTFGFC